MALPIALNIPLLSNEPFNIFEVSFNPIGVVDTIIFVFTLITTGIFGFSYNPGAIGVIIFIFISGAVLEYNYGRIQFDVRKYFTFVKNRFLKIYPMFWMALVLGAIINIYADPFNLVEFIAQATGLYPFLHLCFPHVVQSTVFGGSIMSPSWFVGTIMLLYLMYPFVSKLLSNYGLLGLLLFAFLSICLNDFTFAYDGSNVWYWSPFSRLFLFALGIYIARHGLYPTKPSPNWIMTMGEFAFPVYLSHYIVVWMLAKLPQTFCINIIVYVGVVCLLSVVLYTLERKIRKLWVKQHD
jgi:peptidoglycan/LPS O-acetylase OafA/YrhL